MALQEHSSLDMWLWLERDVVQLNCVPVVYPVNELGWSGVCTCTWLC